MYIAGKLAKLTKSILNLIFHRKYFTNCYRSFAQFIGEETCYKFAKKTVITNFDKYMENCIEILINVDLSKWTRSVTTVYRLSYYIQKYIHKHSYKYIHISYLNSCEKQTHTYDLNNADVNSCTN